MNAGYGVGDIITVTRLAWDVYKSCKEAPQHFLEVSGEVSRLHIVLKETDDVVTSLKEGLDSSKEAQLRGLAMGCQEVLTDLEQLLSRFKRLGSRSRLTFERLRWSQGDVTALRDRIVLNITLLGAFCATIQMSSHARLEQKLENFIEEFRNGLRADSVVSSGSLGEKETWRQLRKELSEAGIPKDVIKKKRPFIVSWFQEAMASSDLDESDTEPENTSTEQMSDSSDDSYEFTNSPIDDDTPDILIPTTSGILPAATSEAQPSQDTRTKSEAISPNSTAPPASDTPTPRNASFPTGTPPISPTPPPNSTASPAPDTSPRNHPPNLIETLSPTTQPPSLPPLTSMPILPQQIVTTTHPPLHTAEMGNVDKAKTPVESEVDLNNRRRNEKTPLMIAAKKGDVKMMLLLLNSGADIGAACMKENEWTAVHYAAHYGKKEVAQLLLDRGPAKIQKIASEELHRPPPLSIVNSSDSSRPSSS
ncbi:hypothetical protein BDD12DRAFT_806160 [Trichophaea hybrida]|nr:hypothetical protein BDD12DRAFT_806160 [Trichophaea hybrida]